jgi:hypothetical protein
LKLVKIVAGLVVLLFTVIKAFINPLAPMLETAVVATAPVALIRSAPGLETALKVRALVREAPVGVEAAHKAKVPIAPF